MKNILLIGSSSSTSINFEKKYQDSYKFYKMSRNTEFSDVDNFDVMNEKTYLNTENKFDGLIYFPGSINLKPFERIEESDFQNDFNINVMGLIKILKFYKKSLREGSSLIFFSTVASKIGMPFHSSVATVKSAIDGLSKSLAAEWAPHIRVNTISPSLFKSKMSNNFFLSDKKIERISNNHPLKRTGVTDDISSLINFLISDDSNWITGQNISIDGGMSTIKQ
tara:strand:+ start:180 stop:848 length:669 start_codon:yes stop_codon:yes gene_type:complete